MKWIKALIFSLLLMMGSASAVLYHFSRTALTPGDSSKKVEIDILKGMRPIEISYALEKHGIIRSARLFYWLGRLNGGWSGLKAADYELSPSMTPLEIFQIIRSGIGIQRSLLIHEGDNIYQVAETFEKMGLGKKDGVLKLLRSPSLIQAVGLGGEGISSLEGYLFPNTYFFDRRDTAENMIRRMIDGFLHTWTPDAEARAREIGLSRKEVVILASMVEKETGAAFERPMIASVFFNRMKKKMRFQSDPTTAYGMGEFYAGNLRKEDLRRKTPYNTYTIPGLPIGPISNPSREAVRAVLYPADTDFLYFVSKNDGTHMFSKTYGDHSDWVKKLQVDPKAREGKSWRDLSKKGAADGARPGSRSQ
jgi:UPF0755 protein